MDRPPPDPTKLLEAWMEWERGETPPGRVMSNLKTAGLRDLLEDLSRALVTSESGSVAREEAPAAETLSGEAPPAEAPPAEAWKPVV